jgi:hypothetical protein
MNSLWIGLEGLNETDRKAVMKIYAIRGVIGLLGLGAGAYIAYKRKGTGWNYLGWMLLVGGVSGTIASLATIPAMGKIGGGLNVVPQPAGVSKDGKPTFATGATACLCAKTAVDTVGITVIGQQGGNCNDVCKQNGYWGVKA